MGVMISWGNLYHRIHGHATFKNDQGFSKIKARVLEETVLVRSERAQNMLSSSVSPLDIARSNPSVSSL